MLASRRDRLEAWRRSKKRSGQPNEGVGIEGDIVPIAKKSKPLVSDAPTPTKMVFTEAQKENTSPVENKPSAQSIKDKLIASAKKRSLAAAEKLKNEEAASQPVPKFEVQRVTNLNNTKQKNLHALVEKQVEVVMEMIMLGQHCKARDFLAQLKSDTPDAVHVGEFWSALAAIEIALGNYTRAKSAFVHGMTYINHDKIGSFMLKCSDFLSKHDFHGQPMTDEEDLFKEPFANIVPAENTLENDCSTPEKQNTEREEDLSSYLGFNPNTTAKKSLSNPIRVPAEVPKVNSALKSPRVNKQNIDVGSVIVMEAVRNTKKVSETVGSSMSMTPVRRSARKQKGGNTPDINSVLKKTDFTYVPNRALSTAKRSKVQFKEEEEGPAEELL